MDVITINVSARETGKKAARAARRNGNVPCVLYGHGIDSVSFEVPEKELKPIVFSHEKRRVEIKLDKETWDCILKEVRLDAMTSKPLHCDFQVLKKGEKVTLTVPLRFVGTPVGQTTEGGDVQYVLHEITVTCLPKDIPSHIDVNVSELHLGESIHVSDLSVEGVRFDASPEQAVVTVLAPRVETAATESATETETTEEE